MSIYFRSVVLIAVLGCTAKTDGAKNTAAGDTAVSDSAPSVSSAPSRVFPKVKVLFFGTSLTAGYGLDPSIAYPRLIQQKSLGTDTPIEAINAGLSGETSAGAVRRIEWALKNPVDIVVIETGGNDALRALDPDSLEANLEEVVSKAKKAQPSVQVLLVQMESPPNLGARYNAKFRTAYVNAARKENVPLLPFLLDGVAGKDDLNQGDGVHPNAQGERIVADNVWKALMPFVKSAAHR
jgi:acyl-CoA thioesterase-1